jgi:ABC-2 type transport system ATP-binding protein
VGNQVTPGWARGDLGKAQLSLALEGSLLLRSKPSDITAMMREKVVVRELWKSYGQVQALKGISFSIAEGEIFGLLGPNGAGKTTTVEIIEGLRRPDKGEVLIDGQLVKPGLSPELKQRIGVQLQEAQFYDKIRVWELLDLFGSYHRRALPVKELLELVGLEDKARSYVEQLSGGQKRRLSLAAALVNDPELIFLDEPTTGLDPQARRRLWELIAQMKAQRRTVLLTTHYIEEAEFLCDRVGIIDLGELIALGTPEDLIRTSGLESAVTLSYAGELDLEGLKALPGVQAIKPLDRQRVRVETADVNLFLQELFQKFDDLTIERLERPNLEDVFLALTGKELRE